MSFSINIKHQLKIHNLSLVQNALPTAVCTIMSTATD